LKRRSERVLIVGTGEAGVSLTREILSRPDLNLQVVGFLDEKGENIGKSLINPCIIGAAADVDSVVAREKVDRVVLSLAERRGWTPVRQLLDLKFAGVRVEDVHSCYERVTGRILLERLSPSWLILSDGFRKSPILLVTKRAMDLVASFFGLLVSLPVMALTALAVWLETGSPILFRQTRTGQWGHPFEMMKFRSMYQNAEQHGPRWAAEGDNRITRVGRFIRKTRLDELPQLMNVLRGDMSLVGPRPERPHFCAMLEEQIPYYNQRHAVRPGVTGWAQIKYQYGASVEDAKEKLELDLFYIKHLSVMLDLAIIFETLKVMLLGRGAK
jgi:sugar transferase (PEP-CTERM system associated)